MLRVSSETVKTFDVCGKKSPVSCIEETSNVNARRPTFNFKLHESLRQMSVILDSVVRFFSPLPLQ